VPQGRLADARLALEDYPDGPGPRECVVNRMQLGLAADELLHAIRS
jgi:hypothetical protein